MGEEPTASQLAEPAHASPELCRLLMEHAHDAVYLADAAGFRPGRLLEVNDRAAAMLGYTRQELLALTAQDIRLLPDDVTVPGGGERVHVETEHAAKDGRCVPVETSATMLDLNGTSILLAIARDVSERRLAESALRESQDRYQTIVDFTWDWEYWCDVDGTILFCSPSCQRITGHAAHEFLDDPDLMLRIVHEDDREAVSAHLHHRLEMPDTGCNLEFRIVTPSGATRWIGHECQRVFNGGNRLVGVRGSNRDITMQREALQRLRESEERFSKAFRANPAAMLITRVADGTIVDSNDTAACLSGFSLEEMRGKTAVEIGLIADEATRRTYLDLMREDGLLRDYEMTVKARDGALHDVSMSIEPITLGGEPCLLASLFDVTARREAEARLQQTLRETVQALGAVVALRDPYTGGHERRVTLLADAIAEELGLDPDRREGLRLAGEVHDVGKIGVPAEVLSKPARLSDMELQLVRQHPQLGRDILADIAFHWPVAEIVYQHHERLDGSGYPRGLRGEQILLEAKILAVADVVEAIASHRPYRPALGVTAALAEVTGGAGTLFDTGVVLACRRVLAAGQVSLGETG